MATPSDAEKQAALEHVDMILATVGGYGPHGDHDLQQAGRCVHCVTCGERLGQFTLPADYVPASKRRWQVRLADGYVAYRGPQGDCRAVSARHDGSTVELAS